ncbi:hypothetical protein AHF37_09994 [Paragonimus kellicotti]|nr:hypothetical protein AHF37_09994 [Paragonimus kellicotti]
MWQAHCYSFLLLIILAYDCQGIPADDNPQPMEFGLRLDSKTQDARKGFELTLGEHSENETYLQRVRNWRNETLLEIRIEKSSLRLYDNVETWRINCTVVSNSTVPLVVSYDLDSIHAVKLLNSSWYWLPDGNNKFSIPVYILTQQIGLSYLRFWVREAIRKNYTLVQSYKLNSSNEATNHYFSSVVRSSTVVNDTALLGFPVIVLRGQGVVQLVFRIVVVTMVTIFTFTMGCELDPELLKMYARRPIGPAIGFCCQFIIMPLLAFAIGMLIPIKTEFGFGLLTIGCSPGGGASNAWALMLGGDINLSILMTFVSSLSALLNISLCENSTPSQTSSKMNELIMLNLLALLSKTSEVMKA